MKTGDTVLKMMFFIWSVTSQWINKEKTWRGNKTWEECLFISISLSVHLACWSSAVHSESRNYGILGFFFFFSCMSASAKSIRLGAFLFFTFFAVFFPSLNSKRHKRPESLQNLWCMSHNPFVIWKAIISHGVIRTPNQGKDPIRY